MKCLNERIHEIQIAKKSAENDNQRISKRMMWRGKQRIFTSIRIETDYLMYRIDNSRTMWQQIAYKKNHPEVKDIFKDPESKIAQESQEKILLQMLNVSGGQFKQDLINRGQEEPGIITYEGYVVNGNRRLAALREIGERHMECFVLPKEANEADLFEIEQVLQLSQEFKESYHWINELSNIYRGFYEFNYSKENLAKRLRISESQVNSKIRMFELVRDFLDWKMIPENYDYGKLNEAEQIFIELEKETRKKKYTPEDKEAIKQILFSFIENPPEGGGRLYQKVRDLFKEFPTIQNRLINNPEFSNNIDTNTHDLGNQNNFIFENLLDDKPQISINPENVSYSTPIINDTINDVIAEQKEIKDMEVVYQSVSSALRSLTPLKITDKMAKLDATKTKLDQIIKKSTSLISQIDSINFNKNG